MKSDDIDKIHESESEKDGYRMEEFSDNDWRRITRHRRSRRHKDGRELG